MDWRHAEGFELCTSDWIICLYKSKVEHNTVQPTGYAMKSCKIHHLFEPPAFGKKKHVKVNQQGYRVCTSIRLLQSSFNSSLITFFLLEAECLLIPPIRISYSLCNTSPKQQSSHGLHKHKMKLGASSEQLLMTVLVHDCLEQEKRNSLDHFGGALRSKDKHQRHPIGRKELRWNFICWGSFIDRCP